MKISLTSIAALLFTCAFVQRASSELASLDTPWLGYFAVFNLPRTQFRVAAQDAVINIAHSTKKGELSSQPALPVQIFVEETQPDGKKVERPLDPGSLESSQGAAENPDKLVIKAKAEGGVLLEILIEQKLDMIFVGGRVLDPGSLAPHPLGIAIRIPVPAAYVKPLPIWDKKETKTETRANDKAFVKRVASDSIRLKRADGKQQKLSFDKNLHELPDNSNGPGIAEVEIETKYFGGAGFRMAATPNSSIAFANAADAPIYQGFTMIWRSDTANTPETNPRLGMRMK